MGIDSGGRLRCTVAGLRLVRAAIPGWPTAPGWRIGVVRAHDTGSHNHAVAHASRTLKYRRPGVTVPRDKGDADGVALWIAGRSVRPILRLSATRVLL